MSVKVSGVKRKRVPAKPQKVSTSKTVEVKVSGVPTKKQLLKQDIREMIKTNEKLYRMYEREGNIRFAKQLAIQINALHDRLDAI